MVSFLHQLLVELFRNRGELAPELLRRCAGLELEHTRIESRSIDLSQIVPTEYRADSVVELHGRDGATTAAVIVEVQLRSDADKRHTWPIYVTALRRQLRCPVFLLVFTDDPKVAQWARDPIPLGHPGFRLEPIVISYEDLPRILDPAEARRLPELAVLSAMAYRELEVATAAIHGIATLAEDQKKLYLDVILANLPAKLRRVLEARMQGYEYQSDFARRYLNEGRRQGREEGRHQGREEGREEGTLSALHGAVLVLARGKLDVVTEADEAAIAAIREVQALNDLIAALGQARDAGEARAALSSAIAACRGE